MGIPEVDGSITEEIFTDPRIALKIIDGEFVSINICITYMSS